MFIVFAQDTRGAEYCLGIYDEKGDADAHAAASRKKWTGVEVREAHRLKTWITSTDKWVIDDDDDEENEND